MKSVFVDTAYWIAVANPRDSWHEEARTAFNELEDPFLITTEAVLLEFLTHMSQGPHRRKQAATVVRTLLRSPNATVIPLTRDLFLDGLAFYESRHDKEYSLTDCTSMVVMERRSLNTVLTSDHHFEKEGYTILIKK